MMNNITLYYSILEMAAWKGARKKNRKKGASDGKTRMKT
jgi:hypothetical protein